MNPFEVLSSGIFSRDDLKIVRTTCTLSYDDKTLGLIESNWDKELQCAHENNKLLFNGPIYRLENYEKRGPLLIVYVSHTNFKELMGTNFAHPELAEVYGTSYLSNAIALCTFLETSDGKFIFVKRSHNVYMGEGLWHLIAGQFSIENDEAHPLTAFEILFKELFEEGSLAESDIEQCLCLGLIRDAVYFKPELVFYTKTFLNSTEVVKKIESAHDGFEHDEIKVIPENELDSFFSKEKFTRIAQGNYHQYKTEFLSHE